MDKVVLKNCSFQLSCPTCYESINVVEEKVACCDTGEPTESELKRIFSKPELNANKCPCCGQTELDQNYSYETKEVIVGDDLLF